MRTYAAQECQVNSRSVCEVRHEALIRTAALFLKERGDDRGFTGVGRRGGGPLGRQASGAAHEQHRSEYSAHPQEGVKPAHSSLEVQGGTPNLERQRYRKFCSASSCRSAPTGMMPGVNLRAEAAD